MEEKKGRNFTLDLYFKSLIHQKQLEEIEEVFKEKNIDLEYFEQCCEAELEEFEKEIVEAYHLEGKRLKDIADEYDFSYSYIRRIYLEAKDKMRIILNMHIKNNNGNSKNKITKLKNKNKLK